MARKATLTFKQRAFVEAYLANGFNGTEAARTAGYKGNDNVLAVVAYENIRKPKIAALIQERMNEMAMPANEAMARLSMSARSDLGQFIGLSEVQLKQHPQSFLLKKVKFTRRTGGRDEDAWSEEKVELELYDAQAAQLAIIKEHHLIAGEATELVGVLPPDVLEYLRRLGVLPADAFEQFVQLIREKAEAQP